ncbi:putative uncharacterized protein DDB_G0291812 isoform X2 [Oppia nitens]|nr:putative uncharacterized protein DDB_G0291812 isoform X2 [Oppia nitens]
MSGHNGRANCDTKSAAKRRPNRNCRKRQRTSLANGFTVSSSNDNTNTQELQTMPLINEIIENLSQNTDNTNNTESHTNNGFNSETNESVLAVNDVNVGNEVTIREMPTARPIPHHMIVDDMNNQINDNHNNNENTENGDQREDANVCIDLTQDDSIVNNESDSEIECISSVIKNQDLCIIRDVTRKRRQRNDNYQSQPQPQPIESSSAKQSDDVVEIDPLKITTQNNSTSRRSIKCPVCLDESYMFGVTDRKLVATKCGHLFCDRCIQQVIRTSKVCPNCRKKVNKGSYHPIYI